MSNIPDVDVLGKAIHSAKRVGGPWGPPCGYPRYDPNDPREPANTLENWVLIEYDTDPMGTYDCLCRSMAHQLVEEMT